MIMLGKRWRMEIPLANGWSWLHNVGSTLDLCRQITVGTYNHQPFIASVFKKHLWGELPPSDMQRCFNA